MDTASLELFYSPGSCSLGPHILLAEVGAEYSATPVSTWKGEQHAEAYLAVNPRARVPALRVGTHVITENIAVMAFIAARWPAFGLIPLDSIQGAQVFEKLSFFASSVHVAFAQFWRMERFTPDETLHAAVKEGGGWPSSASLAISRQ